MRKNAVNRELISIDGGVCAPSGFYTNAVHCGVLQNDEKSPDFAVILAKKRLETAYIHTDIPNVSAFATLSQKHTRTSKASAILIQGGGACGYDETADDLAEKVSRLFANTLKIDRNEIILISTGEYGREVELSTFESAAKHILVGLDSSNEKSLRTAQVLGGGRAKQLAFSFQIGDVACKIGGIFCGGFSGNEPTVCVLTTDVDISSQMLQKALKAIVNEYFHMLGGRISTPNDCICILASGGAKNWKITENNSDYQKFINALSCVAEKICEEVMGENGFLCKVVGAKSKNAARGIAKAVASSLSVRKSFLHKRLCTQAVLSAVIGSGEKVPLHKVSVSYKTFLAELITFEDNREIHVTDEVEKSFFSNGKIEVNIDLKEGNYTATSYGEVDGL